MLFLSLDSTLIRCVISLPLCAPLLGGCETNPPAPASPPVVSAASPIKSSLEFIDLQGFDRDLHNALSAALPAVDVAFYSRISPSALPERLQKWMAAVESGGGSIKITPAKSTVAAKSPFMVIGVVNFAFNLSKAAKMEAEYTQFKPAKSFNAEIVLKADGEGESIVDKVIFTPRVK